MIAHDHIVSPIREAVEPRLSVGRRVHSIAGPFDDTDDQCAQAVVVVDHEYPRVSGFGRVLDAAAAGRSLLATDVAKRSHAANIARQPRQLQSVLKNSFCTAKRDDHKSTTKTR